MSFRRSSIWADAAGTTAQTILRGSGSLSAVDTALQAKSNAAMIEEWTGTDTFITAAPTSAQFESVADYVNLLYSTATGAIVRVRLVAPVASIFLADLQTVDPVQVAGITAAVLATVVDVGGNPVTAFVGGLRQRRNRDY